VAAAAGLGPVEKPSAFDGHSGSSLSPPSSDSTAYLQYTKCESILKWPILQTVIATEDASIDSFIFDAHVLGDGEEGEAAQSTPTNVSTSPRPNSRGGIAKQPKAATIFGQGVRDQAFVTLCQKFLALVNCRNPIMDAHDLLQYASSVAEDGLDWDAKSCLVVSHFSCSDIHILDVVTDTEISF
jgi:hypothetical protein